MAKRKSKHIENSADVKEILELTQEHAGEKSLIMSWFGDFGKGPRFQPYDTVTIPKGTYGKSKKNKNAFKTTLGLWVFNKACIENMSDVLGYINETVDMDKYEDINQIISYALLENKITIEQLKNFIMVGQIYMGCTCAICPSHTMDMLLLTTKAEAKKKQLEKEHAEGIKNVDLKELKIIENEMIDWAKDQLKDSESADMYNSGARSSWKNNFKNMYLIKGPIKHTDSTYSYVSASYIEGTKKEDYSAINDAAIGGPFSRSNKTQEGGYIEKQFTNATQHVKVMKPGSDCKTKLYITTTLTKKNIKDWMYCFVIGNNGSLTEITSDNRDKFIGKTVKIRFSALCQAKNGYICEKCAGTLYNRIGIENIGLACNIMASSMKNAAMKAFHDSSLDLSVINPNDAFC